MLSTVMFKIGEFSRFTRVTVKMLRHYDEIGLLEPSFVEAGSGYRHYLADQLPRLNQIIALKDLGFSLDAIAVLIDERAAPERKAALLDQRRAELERAIADDAARLRHLDALASGVAGAGPFGRYDVVLRAVPACTMATIRRRVASLGEPVTALFEQLEEHVGQQRARAAASPFMILHDDEYRDVDLDVEIAVPLRRTIDETEAIRVREVDGSPTMACVIYRGGYDQTSAVLQTLLAWMELHAMQIAGPLREVYLRFSADQDGYRLPSAFLAATANELVTELQLPVARGAS
jgi:DNA-binding transcriptional MerR regulator